jgi:HSP20 family molecular chaperone IbpA
MIPYWSIFPETIIRDVFSKYDFQRAFENDRDFPPYDVYENEDGSMVLEFALAGYLSSQLSVENCGNKLEISAKKIEEEVKKIKGTRRIARRSFKKIFTDTEGKFDLSQTEVEFCNGILSVKVPLKLQHSPNKIKITTK